MRKIFLKDADLIRNTAIGGSVDTDKYKFCVRDAQETGLMETLGEELYDKIDSLYTANAEFPAGDYKILFDKYIIPYLIRQAAVEYLTISSFDIGNNGNSTRQPEGQIAASENNEYRIINTYKHKANMYRERMEKYLREKANLPEYKYSSNNIVNPTTQKGGVGDWYF